MKTLYDIAEDAPDVKPAPVTGSFKTWLETPEGQRQLSKGIADEREHTTKHEIARRIALHHLKEDRKYYSKLKNAGLAEGIYDDPNVVRRDMEDDLIDPHEDDDVDMQVDIGLAIKAIQNPVEAKKYAAKSGKSRRSLIASLKQLATTVSQLVQSLPIATVEASMGVAGPMIANPEIEPGSGVLVKEPLRNGLKNKKPVPAKRLRPSSPANGNMVGTNPMVPGRSAFAKAVE